MTPLPYIHEALNCRDPETDDDDDDDDDDEKGDEDEYGEEEGKEEEIEDLPLLETPENPLGYKLPRVRKNEKSDWTWLLLDMKKKHREKGNYFAKRFVQQVRESRGYDVDCLVSSIFMSPFRPKPNFKKNKAYYADVKKAAQYAVDKLNAFRSKHKVQYKLVDVQKVVTNASGLLVLLTFTVEQVSGPPNVYKLDKQHYYRDHEFNQPTVPDDDDDDDDDEQHNDNDNVENKNKGESNDKDGNDDVEDNKDQDGDDVDDGEPGTILTCQATVDVCWFRKCKGYKLKEVRVKPVTKAVPAA